MSTSKILGFFTWARKTFGGMVTEHDNSTHDIIKHGSWIGLLAILAHDAWELHTGLHVDVRDFSIAIATILFGTGVGVAVKRSSEHDGGPNA